MATKINGIQDKLVAMNATIQRQAAAIDVLTSQLAAAQTGGIFAIGQYVDLVQVAEPSNPAVSYPTIVFHDVNVQILKGSPVAKGPSGLGNLIIGPNNPDAYAFEFCSNGYYQDQTSCTAAGEVWASNQHTGSHNLVIGDANAYTHMSGLVVGAHNIINAQYANVTGGIQNMANGYAATVSGGVGNVASAINATVSGGSSNVASGSKSSVSGGLGNTASGDNSSVTGGINNSAELGATSVTGGKGNVASGIYATISGGENNSTFGFVHGVTICGGRNNSASGDWSTIGGGANRTVTGQDDWRAGALFQDF